MLRVLRLELHNYLHYTYKTASTEFSLTGELTDHGKYTHDIGISNTVLSMLCGTRKQGERTHHECINTTNKV